MIFVVRVIAQSDIFAVVGREYYIKYLISYRIHHSICSTIIIIIIILSYSLIVLDSKSVEGVDSCRFHKLEVNMRSLNRYIQHPTPTSQKKEKSCLSRPKQTRDIFFWNLRSFVPISL